MQLFLLHHPVFTLKELLVVLVLHAHAHRRLNAQRLGDLYTVEFRSMEVVASRYLMRK